MSTHDVPGANDANRDVLAAGCWAEHKDGSLIFVKGNERSTVIYELYDVVQDPPVYYQDAMDEGDFKKAFSAPPIGAADDDWTWHDKTPFPWSRVMSHIDRPRPVVASAQETLSAAAKVAESLQLRAKKLTEETLEPQREQVRKKGRTLAQRIEAAMEAFAE